MFKKCIIFSSVFLAAMAMAVAFSGGGFALAQCDNDFDFTKDYRLQDCRGFRPFGINPYFLLKVGYQLVLEGPGEDGEEIMAVITVLPKIKRISIPGYGKVTTRVVEEREWEDGELVEVSRNFFAICKKTNSVFYFGEEVDDYEDGKIVGHEGEWLAGENGAMPGIIMPGTFLLGSRYYQEYAEGVAEDRGENTSMGMEVVTQAGTFSDCVTVIDTNPLDGVCSNDDGDEKIYAPGVGLIVDETLELVDYGINIFDVDEVEEDDDDDDDDDGDDEE
jgi:hypothetical protein